MTLRNPKKNPRKESWQRFKWYNQMALAQVGTSGTSGTGRSGSSDLRGTLDPMWNYNAVEFSQNLDLGLSEGRSRNDVMSHFGHISSHSRFNVTLPGFEKVFFSTSKNVTIFLELGTNVTISSHRYILFLGSAWDKTDFKNQHNCFVEVFLAAALSRVMRAAVSIPAVAAASVSHSAAVGGSVVGVVGLL